MTAEENNIFGDRHQVNLHLHKKGSILYVRRPLINVLFL